MKRLPLAIALAVALVAIPLVAPFGSSIRCHNTDCIVFGRSSILAVGLGIAFFAAVWFAPRRPVTATNEPATIGRKVMAILADVGIVATSFGPVIALPLLWIEAAYTGGFAWQFVRSFARPTDWIVILGTLALVVLAAWTWRRWLNASNKASVGQFLAGYTVFEGKSLRFAYS
jgi:hypothetical protein